ncbi:hypothetical protein [Spirosoma endbachense]|uniref:Uncharacterized protein n=1 Tax=Spirosoma endbachense TaxID=2666025 RepID=A0A6P1VMY9_9BACT|nr:hypothetical protein [Spirosoma endbachense]QHV94443.1 hypothetical protein GJR95_05155 [Spirosoma endbachense]
MLYDFQSEQAKVIGKVCQANDLKDETGKIIRLIGENEYAIPAGFVLNDKTQE